MQARYSPHPQPQIHITVFAIDAPKINLLRAANGNLNYSTPMGHGSRTTAANKESNTLIPNLTVGRVAVQQRSDHTIGTTPAPGTPATPLRPLLPLPRSEGLPSEILPVTDRIPAHRAHLPGDATVSLQGQRRPINPHDAPSPPSACNTRSHTIDHRPARLHCFVDLHLRISAPSNQ